MERKEETKIQGGRDVKANKYNNNKKYRDYLRLIRNMNAEQKEAFENLLNDVRKLKDAAEEKNITRKQFTKALFIVDMNNGFVNFGAMHNK